MATPIVLARAPGKPTSEAAHVCAELGIIPSAWHDAQREGGRFQGVAVGSRTAELALKRCR